MKDINILAVDTSGKTLAVAILQNKEVLAATNKITGLTHSEVLLPEIIALLTKAGIALSDIDGYACANGPGSFTGLRIGISTVKGLSQVTGKPMIEVGTLDGLCENIIGDSEIVCPLIDARHGEVYCAVYKNREKIRAEACISIDALAEFLKTLGLPVMFNGDGAASYREQLTSLMGNAAIFAENEKMQVRGESVGIVGYRKLLNGETKTCNDFSVMYLKPSQPEMKNKITINTSM